MNHSADPGADSSLIHRCVDKQNIHDTNSDDTTTTAAARNPIQSFDSATFSDDELLRVLHFLCYLFLNNDFFHSTICSKSYTSTAIA